MSMSGSGWDSFNEADRFKPIHNLYCLHIHLDRQPSGQENASLRLQRFD